MHASRTLGIAGLLAAIANLAGAASGHAAAAIGNLARAAPSQAAAPSSTATGDRCPPRSAALIVQGRWKEAVPALKSAREAAHAERAVEGEVLSASLEVVAHLARCGVPIK